MSGEISEYKIFEVRCRDVMEEEGVRFAGIINKFGKLEAGGFKPGISPLEKDNEKFNRFLKRVIKISSRTENEESLGKLNYITARRDKVVLISFPFPVTQHILLVSAEPFVDIEKLSERITKIFNDSKIFSAWDMKTAT